MDKNIYDILPTNSSKNSYNRYPFVNYDEAVVNLKGKSLEPGEIAVAYYFDQDSIIGINAVFAFGNLKKAGNIIFKNGDMFDNQFQHIDYTVAKQTKTINQLVSSINNANKNWSDIESSLIKLNKQFEETVKTQHIELIDLDNYNLDL